MVGKTWWPWVCAAVVMVGSMGCSPTYVSDAEDPSLDSYTMSLRFDRKDLDRLYDDNIKELLGSGIAKQWERQSAMGKAPVVAVLPMRNETSEHIQTDALLSKFETDLINKSPADVIDYRNQPNNMAEVRRQMDANYDPSRVAAFGRQLGAQYIVTGKVYDVAERVANEKRVQYFMFVRVVEVETSAIKFQNESKITKALVR